MSPKCFPPSILIGELGKLNEKIQKKTKQKEKTKEKEKTRHKNVRTLYLQSFG